MPGCLPQLFRLRQTRSGKIAQEVLGDKTLPGVLVVDRYAGYNKAPCEIQYCQAHLLRDVQHLGEELPEQMEVRTFVQEAAPLLAETMTLERIAIRCTFCHCETGSSPKQSQAFNEIASAKRRLATTLHLIETCSKKLAHN